jgi:hypothetical protein
MTENTKPGTLVFAIIFVLMSVLLLTQIGEQTKWVSRKALPSQPRFWPFIGLSMMVGFGLVNLWQSRRASFGGSSAEAIYWLKGLEYAAWFIGYVLMVPYIGYLPASLLVASVLVLRSGFRGLNWIGASLLFAFSVVILFRAVLRVNVPGGAIYHALPEPLSSFMLTYL